MTGPALTLAFVALAAVFACLAFVSWRKCAAVLTEIRGIASALRSVRSKVETHDAEIDSVTDALHQLRGKFYAERRKYLPTGSNSDSPGEATSAATSKDELRRRIGLVAGKPAPHK
jgi:hypothetical protein